MRVFQIGFNKCGTRTLYSFFRRNGKSAVHWQKGNVARTIFMNLANGRPIIAGMDDVDVFTDMEWLTKEFCFEAYKLFPYFYREYPDAVFILNTRDRERWIKSRIEHGNGSYLARSLHVLRIDSKEELVEFWRNDWDRHHARAREFFAANNGRFFEFDIEKEDGASLVAKLPDMNLKAELYAHQGATRKDED